MYGDVLLQVDNISKRFDNVVVLRGLSFTVREGEIYALVGPNGAGKTTTIRIVVGLLKPDSGRVLVRGVDVHRDRVKALKYMSYVPDNPVVYGELAVHEYLLLVARLRGIDVHKAERVLEYYYEIFELTQYKYTMLADLSRGTLQKVLIVAALFPETDLVVLDEPFNSIDVVAQKTLKDILLERKKEGKSTLLSSHILPHVQDIADRVLVLRGGEKHLEASVQELLARYGENRLDDILVKVLRE